MPIALVTSGRAGGLARNRRALFLAIAAALGSTPWCSAATWDRGAGNDLWSNATNWNPNAEPGSGTDVTFPTPIPGGFSTITMSSGEACANMTFNESYTLSGGGGNLLLADASSILIAAAKTVTFSIPLDVSGSGLLGIFGGTLVMNNASSRTGTAIIQGGVVHLNNAAALGSGSAQMSFNGVLELAGGLDFVAPVFLGTAGLRASGGQGAISSVVTVGDTAAHTVNLMGGALASDTLKIGNVSPNAYTAGPTATSIVTGPGTVYFPASNNYAGHWQINSGTLRVANSGSLGSGTSAIVVNNSGTLLLDSVTFNRAVTLNNGSTLAFNLGGQSQNTHTIASGAATTFAMRSGFTKTIGIADDAITGGGAGSSITVTDDGAAGVLQLTQSSNYIGSWSIGANATVEINQNQALGNTANPVTMTSALLRTTAGMTSSRAFSVNAATFEQNAGTTLTISGVISGSGGGLTKTGGGTLTLAGGSANTYTGLTSVNEGTLVLAKSAGNAIATNLSVGDGSGSDLAILGAAEQIANGNVNVFANGVFHLNGFNETVGTVTMSVGQIIGNGGTLTTTGTVSTFSSSASAQINANFNLNNADRAFNVQNGSAVDDLIVNGVISNGSLTKTNGGSMTLSGSSANTYTGTTTINGGMLTLQKSTSGVTALPGNVTLGFNGAATLRLAQSEQIANSASITGSTGATVDLSTFTETINNLTMTAGQITGAGGTLILNGSVTTNASATTATIAPQVNLGGGTRTFSIADGAAASDLTVSGLVVSGTLDKTGAGTLTLTASAAAPQNLTINVNAGALIMTQTQRLAALNVATGTVATLAANGTRVLSADTLSIAGTGRLDLNDNKLIVPAGGSGGVGSWNGSNYGGVTGMIKSGRNGSVLPLWDGSGIIASMTAATSGVLTTLAIATAGQVGKTTFGGISVASTDVLVMYTYGGDANLSGFIDADDYFQIDSNYGKTANGAKSFRNGDFNYDGLLDGDDYDIIDSAFSGQGAPFSPGPMVEGVTAVPEPTALPLAAGVLLLARRRRVCGAANT